MALGSWCFAQHLAGESFFGNSGAPDSRSEVNRKDIVMLTAAKIILVIVLVLLLVIALIVWWLISKFKGVLSAVKEGLENASFHPPCRVDPQPEPNPQWRNPEKMKELLTSFIQSMPEGMKTKQVEELGNSTIENKIRWTFDTAKGWPTRTSATTRLKNGDQVTTQTSGFTLVEGPTMVAKDEAQSAESQPAAPARP